MSDEQDPEWLDSMIRDEAYIDDAGFSDALMARLPPPRAVRRRRRVWVVGVSTLLGLVFALFGFGGADVLGQAFVELATSFQTQTISAGSLAVLGGMLGAAIAVMWRSLAVARS